MRFLNKTKTQKQSHQITQTPAAEPIQKSSTERTELYPPEFGVNSPIQRQEVNFTDEEVAGDVPTEDQDLENYITAIKDHLQVLIDRYQTAFGNFSRQVQDNDLGSSNANILGAATNKAIEMGTQKLVGAIGSRIPFFGEAVDIVGAINSEISRAASAATEDRMDDFINNISTITEQTLSNEKLGVERNKNQIIGNIRTRLNSIGGSDNPDRIAWLVENIVHTRNELLNHSQIPSAGQIELAMVQEWLGREHGMNYEGWGVWSSKGHLFFEYEIDEEEGTAELSSHCLAGGAYANTLLEVIRNDVFRGQRTVAMSELGLRSKVKVTSNQNRMKTQVLEFGEGRIDGRDDAWNMFSTYIRHLPESINIQTLAATEQVLY